MARRGFMDDSDRLTARQYAAIGRVAALWAETEWAMERILTRLALVPSLLGFILTDKLGPDNRINAIYSLIDVHRLKYAGFVDAAVLTEIEECLSSIGEMKGDRNFIVHSVWAKSDDASISRTDITGAARSGAHITVGPSQSLKSIEDFAEQVDEAAKVLWELGSKDSGRSAHIAKKIERTRAREPSSSWWRNSASSPAQSICSVGSKASAAEVPQEGEAGLERKGTILAS